jgi:cytochrome c oxidase subunit 2
MTWTQNYDPFGSALLSPLAAATPVVLLLGLLATGRVPAQLAALAGLAAAVVTAAAVASGVVLADIEKPKPATQRINVTAQQFAWSFDYASQGIKNAGQLHLVKGVNYQFLMRTKDVIHSFWVPEFRLKKDAVPGMTTEIRVKPTRFGTYSLVCAELCGLGHGTMRARVIVENRASFDRWVAAQKKAAGGAGAQGAAGAQGGGV